MKKTNTFKGMGKVFRFTLGQNVGSTGYKAVTAVVGIIIVVLLIILNIVMAGDGSTSVKNVLILDASGLNYMDIDSLIEYNTEEIEGIEDVKFEFADSEGGKGNLMKQVSDTEGAVGIYIVNENDSIVLNVYVDENSEVTEGDAQEMGEYVSGYIDQIKILNAGLTQEQITVLFTPINVSDNVIGEQTSLGKTLVNMLAPMIFAFILYFMLLFYGQTISKSVTLEKTSKLMEYILTSTKAYALIAGKILAMAVSAIIQFVIWIVCVIAGYLAGDIIAKEINPDYNNVVLDVLKAISNETKGAFSWQAAAAAFVAFCLGFLFYCVLAGLVASFSQRAEGLAQLMIVYNYIVIFGFFIAYFGSLMENNTLIALSKYLPLCSPFSLPANIVIGALSTAETAVSMGILAATTIVVIIITGRVYKALVLYNGAKITPKVIKNAVLGRM